ncbi:hypothetical protein FHS87_004541 [Roseomonas pecuniae]|uniref:ATP-grasp domain-containing protein n=1 Tax=Muricoccus pecuniae TaxID=693023 RepID=A0A840Y959_9PROT|nr:hypothetical protein [Roseomonas pecuniae]
MNGQKAISVLLTSRERVRFDLSVSILADSPVYMFLRDWTDIAPWREFRCFMIGRELRGISQYHYRGGQQYNEIMDHETEIRSAIASFFPKFRDACHLDDVVFDLAYRGARDPILIEINPSPLSGLSDLCLFEREHLNGEFRFLRGAVSS